MHDQTLPVALSDADVAVLYDELSPWDPERTLADAFYHELVMGARDVLDVGCGTGSMLGRARDSGHTGRLVGVDPDAAMLGRAQRRDGIEWVLARACEMSYDREFDLATMTSHAFQCLVDDDDLRASVVAIRRAVRPDGVFAFETRHPRARAWEEWTKQATEVTAPSGRVMRVSYDIDSVADGVVTLDEVYSDPDGTVVRRDRGRLRFLDVEPLSELLAEVGFQIADQYGDFERGPITDRSEEIVTVARRV